MWKESKKIYPPPPKVKLRQIQIWKKKLKIWCTPPGPKFGKNLRWKMCPQGQQSETGPQQKQYFSVLSLGLEIYRIFSWFHDSWVLRSKKLPNLDKFQSQKFSSLDKSWSQFQYWDSEIIVCLNTETRLMQVSASKDVFRLTTVTRFFTNFYQKIFFSSKRKYFDNNPSQKYSFHKDFF